MAQLHLLSTISLAGIQSHNNVIAMPWIQTPLKISAADMDQAFFILQALFEKDSRPGTKYD